MSKQIDRLNIEKLPKDRCPHCFFQTSMSPVFLCHHPERDMHWGFDNHCTIKDWGRCPYNREVESRKL